jgi:hypothetical protein
MINYFTDVINQNACKVKQNFKSFLKKNENEDKKVQAIAFIRQAFMWVGSQECALEKKEKSKLLGF